MAAVKDSITGLYITYFNRAPDAGGSAYWEAQAAAQGNTAALFGISSAFAQNSVAVTNYPSSLTNTQFVQQVYGYALNRGSAVPNGITSIGPIDAAGQAFWEGRLASGLSRSDMMVEFINAVLDYTGTDANGLQAQQMIRNKVAVGQAFAASNNSNVVLDNAGNPDTASAVYQASLSVMNGVTGTLTTLEQQAKVAAATSTVNALAPSAYSVFAQQTSADEGTTATFKLNTTNVANGTVVNYTLSGTGVTEADVTGGLIGTATVNNNTATISVNLTQDQVAESNETLSIAITGQTLSSSSVPSTIINDSTGQIILAAGTSQVVNNIGASTPVKIVGDQTTGVTLNVTNAALLLSTNDILTVTLDKAGDSTATSIVKVDNVLSDGLETLNIVSSGVSGNVADNQYYTAPRDTGLADNNVISSLSGLSTSNVSQINISGASDLSLITGAINKNLNISTATATGNIYIDASLNLNPTNITGGSGEDTLWGSQVSETINGGNGNDVIRGWQGGDLINGGLGNDIYSFYSGPEISDSKVSTLSSFDKVTVTSGDGFYNTDQNMTVGTFTAGIQTTAAINTAQDLLSALTQVVNAASTPLVKNSGYLVAITDSSALYNGTYLVVESGLNLGAVDADDTVMQLIGITGTAAITADASGSLTLSF